MHEHHHHHEEGCACPGCSGEMRQEALQITSHLQDEAAVVSVKYQVYALAEKIDRYLPEQLETLARDIEQHKGIIGHIKASVEVTQVKVYSLTDARVMERQPQAPTVTLSMAAIVFRISEDALKHMVKVRFCELDQQLAQ